ncbi:no child left behind isoform X2 [Anoplolepis gracilipes]|uniref:no child left behind isoform X2 n=1 Tax=Anoplolepis gracilipes TaxID=354296 RepID=UPI003B9E375C
MEPSDGIDKSWDYPWTTEEMRKKRREWSLAGDVGLLKHLQQFSENLMTRTNKTQAALDTLTTQLKETGILVDNVTNTSLALANTQFIESRVQEDDIELKENSEKQETKTQDLVPESLLASISKSVKQGLNIMDEKYKVMDVACSDSEEEDEGGAVVFSVIVGPNDPYQDRPLPYVIGSDKWMASNKIGLESSSSESEQADEERDESESEKEDTSVQKIFNSRHNPDVNIARLSSSSSDSDNYNDSNNAPYKADTISQNNINSASESVTPNNVSKTSNETEPNFAEELAKRLGTVRQAQNPVIVDEASESSINRFKSDLFTSEKDENVFSDSSDNLFSNKKGLFDDQVSANLWKEKPIKSYKRSNIIPPSIDVPPPINIVSTKPKSAIDDLFADADSDEDSDIFSSINIIKKHAKEPVGDNIRPTAKGFLNVMKTTGNIATSTPESNVNASGLFNDDENDDANLFGSPKKESHKAAGMPSFTNTIQESSKKESVLGKSVLSSDIESKLSSRIMQRRQESSGSTSDSEPGNSDDATKNNTELASAERDISNDNAAIADRRLQITPAENSAENAIENTNSSGIYNSLSIDNTAGSGLWMNFQPEMTSTRLKSEEIYRERVTSDSLFTAQTRSPANPVNNNGNNHQQQSRQEQQDNLSLLQDDVFENDDLFGPPPLPTKSDSKRGPKSKISLLFDDSDSGDELFSAASSGSRSQKSTDFFAAVSSSDRTTKTPARSGGLFDDNNIFGGKDAPDIDIFGVTSKSKDAPSDDLFDSRGREQYSVTSKSSNVDNLQNTKMESKRISLFDDDDGDLFTGAKPTKPKSDRKTDVLFEDEDDLFLSNKTSDNRHSSVVEKGASVEPKIDVSKNVSSLEAEKNKNDSSDYTDGLFSKATKNRNLLFENDDYDDLFSKKDPVPREDERLKAESKEVKKNIIEKLQELEQNKDAEFSTSNRDIKTTTESKNVVAKSNINEEKNKAEVGETSSKAEEDGRTKKNSPPKTLSIRTTSSPPSEEQNGQQVPRKSVSGKIKNLMEKMSDLKILSPMDAPPLWRKSEDKADEDEDIVDRDNEEQGTSGYVSPPSVSEGSARKESSYSTTISTASNVEVAINFDDLAQVETLSTTASKSRVRIQAKRRPQSRHARKSALRHSGIDFDTVDSADNDNSLDESHTSTFSSTKDLSGAPAISAADRLTANNAQRSTVDPSSTDDKSELGSISKESSMSVNKNTLLSPSTDEEDLFDVPPDLPEDPQREDTLFGRAPILSPIDDGQSDITPVAVKPLIDTVIRNIDDIDINTVNNKKSLKLDSSELMRSDVDTKSDTLKNSEKKDDKSTINEERGETSRESSEEPSDPLRDNSHDPLKDPSQLFAFVTKTPSPEKSKGLLFSESDDSLFSSGSAKKSSEPKKKILDLFADDDVGGDLFSSAPLKKTVKKPLRDTKIGLFGDDDDARHEDNSLFGSVSSKTKQDNQKSNLAQPGRKKNNIFDDDDDDDSSLFVESSGQSQKSDSTSFSEPKHDLADSQVKSSNLKDIFGDVASNDDDDANLFATRKVVPKKVVKSLFASDDENDDDDGHIFGKQSSTSTESKINTTTITQSSKPAMKKSVTRDLKKTAEKIVEDPLSLLQDD